MMWAGEEGDGNHLGGVERAALRDTVRNLYWDICMNALCRKSEANLRNLRRAEVRFKE
jgi:hypothetical protein